MSGVIYCENCESTLSLMSDNTIDLVFTSPPYYNVKKYSQYDGLMEYLEEMNGIFELVFQKLKEGRMCVVNISPILEKRKSRNFESKRIPLHYYFIYIMENNGFEFVEDIIWVKPEGAVSNRNGGFFRHRKPLAYKPNIITEYVFVFKKPSLKILDKFLKNDSLVEDGYERTNVWFLNPNTISWHPAPFPESLVERIVKYYSYENDLVYDPFAGSGTTGKVCEKLNRRWIMSEINKEFCEKMKEDMKYN